MPSRDPLRDEIFAASPGLEVAEKLFDDFDDAIFCVKNSRRQYVAVNDAFVSRVGLRNKSALLGRTARELFPPLLAAGYEQQDDAVFATGREIQDRLEMITNPDGGTGWYLSRKVPVRNAREAVIALAGISRDLHTPAESDPRLDALAGLIGRIQSDYAEPLRIDELRAARGCP